MDDLTDLRARGHVVKLLRQVSNDDRRAALTELDREGQWVDALTVGSTARERDLYRDAVDDTTVDVLADEPSLTASDWETLLAVATRRRRLAGAIEVASFRALNRAVVTLAAVDPISALARFLDVCRAAGGALVSGPQRKDIASYLHGSQRELVRVIDRPGLKTLIEAFEWIPVPIAESLVRMCSTYRSVESRDEFAQLIRRGRVDPHLSVYVSTNLSAASRRVGVGMLPAILG
jgi:hypothetical protein